MKQQSEYNIRYDKPIECWEKGLPLGNGSLGCLIHGASPLVFAIDRIDLWDNRVIKENLSSEYKYSKLVKLISQGRDGEKEKDAIFENADKYPYPTKLSAGRILLEVNGKENNFSSTLDIVSATAEIEYNGANIKTFVSEKMQTGVIRVCGEYSVNLHIPRYISGGEEVEKKDFAGEGLLNYDYCLGYPKAEITKENGYVYYVQKTHTDYEYALIVYIDETESRSDIYYTVVTSEDDKNVLEYGKKLLLSAKNEGYDKLLSEHVSYRKVFMAKSAIDIPDKNLERCYYRSWYLFASTSRTFPMPLQGVWTADNDALPPWRGDYHFDTNVQMSYWGYAKANRLKEGRVLVDYLWKLRGEYKKFAKRVYGVEGYIISGCSTINGKPMGGWVQFSLSPTLTIWSAKAFDDYYFYTGDESFLKRRAFPFFKEVGKAIRGLMHLKEGKLYLPLSSSPEIYEEDAVKNFSVSNTNFDQALILYLFKTLKRYCEILGHNTEEYDEILSRLDGLYVSEDKSLMLSKTEKMPFSHRHFSHMTGIYPLNLLHYDIKEEREIIEASLLETERLGTGWWVGFSFPWCALMYAAAKNGNAAYEKLRIFEKGFVEENGFHLNGDFKNYGFSQWHYRPFTLEASFGFCDALQEMLLQEREGYLEVFPAIPEEWEKGKLSFKNLRSFGGVLVCAKRKNGKVTEFTVKSPSDRTISVKNPENGKIKKINLKRGLNDVLASLN